MTSLAESQKRKRKLKTPGIFDPNYSNNPQYGNVATLEDGVKRIHFHHISKPGKATKYRRFQIIIPECQVPTIDSSQIDKVTKIRVPVVKDFVVDNVEPNNIASPYVSALYIGLFEADQLETEFPSWSATDAEDKEYKIDSTMFIEPLFILNKPIAYRSFESDLGQVSNIPERGYVCLQNYLNIFVGFKNFQKANRYSFNCYIDYKVCDIRYEDALVWRANFESMISENLKYRVKADTIGVTVISRGDLQVDEADDPSQFPTPAGTFKRFKVAERDNASAGLRGEQFTALELSKIL